MTEPWRSEGVGPLLQLRLWARQSAPAEVVLTTLVGLAAIALTIWAVLPPGTVDAVTASGAPTEQPLSQPTAPGTVVVPTAPGATAAPTTPGGLPLPTLGPIATGGTTGTGGGTTGLPGTTGTTGGVPVTLTASDVGVTPSTIKVGFGQMDLAGVGATGLGSAAGLRGDIPQVIAALVDDANKHGGVHGRKIVPDIKKIDLINADDQRAKCLQFTETDKVFAVIDSVGMLFPQGRACVAAEHKTPLVTGLPMGVGELKRAAPYEVSPNGDENQLAKLWVDAAKKAGFFDKAKGFTKLGLLSDECDRSSYDDPQVGLKAYLHRAGVTDAQISEFKVKCTVDAAQTAPPSAVVQFRRDGVTHVFPATFNLVVTNFLKTAQTQGWKPKYFVSSFRTLSNDNEAKDFDPNQWDGVQGITVTHSGETGSGLPISKRAQDCSKILTSHGLAPIKSYAADAEAIILCDNLTVFLKAANAAPANLTRFMWGQAVQTLGTVDVGWAYPAKFSKGVFAAGGRTQAALVQWYRACSCYKRISTPFSVS